MDRDTSHIVYESAAKIREVGRSAARGKWGRLFLSCMIIYGVKLAAVLLICLLSALLPLWHMILSDDGYFFLNLTPLIALPFCILLTVPLPLGRCSFVLGSFRSQHVSYGRIFFGYKMFFKILGLLLLVSLKIYAWSLLFVIPGYVAYFRYSMSLYVLADHPDWKIRDCINESKRLMKGNKSKLFCLQLSFVGWGVVWLLSVMGIFMIISMIVYLVYDYLLIYGAFELVSVIMLIFMIAVSQISITPLSNYISMSVAAFYELASGHLKVTETEFCQPTESRE